METVVLSSREVAALLPPEQVVPMVDTVFREWGHGNVVMPPKVTLNLSRSGSDSWSNAMPAYIASANVAGIKWVGGYAGNQARELPYIMGVIVLTDPDSGRTMAVMDAVYISDWRTGASAAVAGKYLAPDPVRKIAMVGAGAQGRTATVCLHQVFPGAEIAVADISRERRQAFREDMRETFRLPITDAGTVEAAVTGADVVVLLTTAKAPILKADWLGEGCLTLAMGSYQQTEDSLILGSDRIVVDCWSQAEHRGELKSLAERGEISPARIHAELGVIAAGNMPGRQDRKERILAVLVGLGAHDVYIAGQVYQRALARGTGQRVRLLEP